MRFLIQIEKQGVKINLSYRYIVITHVLFMALIQIFSIALGLELLAKNENASILLVFEIYVGTVPADGCVSSFLVIYWFYLENVADRIDIINEGLRSQNFIWQIKRQFQ